MIYTRDMPDHLPGEIRATIQILGDTVETFSQRVGIHKRTLERALKGHITPHTFDQLIHSIPKALRPTLCAARAHDAIPEDQRHTIHISATTTNYKWLASDDPAAAQTRHDIWHSLDNTARESLVLHALELHRNTPEKPPNPDAKKIKKKST